MKRKDQDIFLAIDVGNTNVVLGVFKGGSLFKTLRFKTELLKTTKKTESFLKKKTRSVIKKDVPEAVYICSVAPSFNARIKGVAKSVFKAPVVLVGVDVVVPIMNRYRILKQVGQDRLVNAYAGLKLYGNGLIIVDFGTAITFDVVSKKREYLGGLIAPGLRLMQEELHKKTELLPCVGLARPIEIIGKDTVSSIRAGIIYGVAGLCDGILKRLLQKACRGYQVIATGGDASLIKSYSTYLTTIDEFLILKGLALLYQSQNNIRKS